MTTHIHDEAPKFSCSGPHQQSACVSCKTFYH